MFGLALCHYLVSGGHLKIRTVWAKRLSPKAICGSFHKDGLQNTLVLSLLWGSQYDTLIFRKPPFSATFLNGQLGIIPMK